LKPRPPRRNLAPAALLLLFPCSPYPPRKAPEFPNPTPRKASCRSQGDPQITLETGVPAKSRMRTESLHHCRATSNLLELDRRFWVGRRFMNPGQASPGSGGPKRRGQSKVIKGLRTCAVRNKRVIVRFIPILRGKL